MYNLPSEQKEKIKKAVKFIDTYCRITIKEPCNCGFNIRHNDGGNYHAIVTIVKDDNAYFIKKESTCELDAPAEWYPLDDPETEIERLADWL